MLGLGLGLGLGLAAQRGCRDHLAAKGVRVRVCGSVRVKVMCADVLDQDAQILNPNASTTTLTAE